MKNENALQVMEHIDAELIEEAESYAGARKRAWVRWGAVAACLCLAAAGAVVLPRLGKTAPKDVAEESAEYREEAVVLPELGETAPEDDAEESVEYWEEAVGFSLEGKTGIVYYPISFSDRLRFGLVPEGSVGLTSENTYRITEADLGEAMGTVGNCPDAAMVGKSVYHFAAYPESNAICILDNGGEYEFYCAEGYAVGMAEENSSDALMALFSFPENCRKIEVQSTDLETLFTITDEDKINELCDLLSGCENIGHEAAERRFAQLWQDTNGNDNVYFSEEDGFCRYRGYVEPEVKTYTDENGNSYTEFIYPEGYVDPSDAAHALWDEGERCLVLETKDGLQLFIDYFPSIGVFFSQDGQFAVTADKAERLGEMLK